VRGETRAVRQEAVRAPVVVHGSLGAFPAEGHVALAQEEVVAGLEVLVAAAVAECADEVGARGVRGGVAAGEGVGGVEWGLRIAELFGGEEVGGAAEEDGVLVAEVGVGQVAWVLFLGAWGMGRRLAGFSA
jgi:hypothetical protein